MNKKWFGVSLALALSLSLVAACGNNENTADNGAEGNDGTVSGSSGSASGKDSEFWEETAEIIVTFPTAGNVADEAKIEAAINEITEKEINTHVTLDLVEIGSYDQQISLKMSSSEPLDLFFSMGFTYQAAQNQLMPMNDLLDEYGQDIKALLGDLLDATTVSGEILGVTPYRILNSDVYAVMRTDVLEDLGLLEKAQNMTSMAEFEEILAAVKENTSYVPLVCDSNGVILAASGCYLSGDSFSEMGSYDQLGDSLKLIAASMDGEGKVYNNFASAEYREMYERVADWYEKGYVYKDAATTQDYAASLVKANVGFAYVCPSEIGVEAVKSAECGTAMTCVKIMEMPITESTCSNFVWTIPVTAAEPEAAMKMLNLMYTDSRIANLLAWGIEGEHYVVKDGVAYYPEGVDAGSCGWHTTDWSYGNQFLVLPWEGQSADFREVSEAALQEAERSPYLGFVCDTENIQTELSSVTSVVNEFLPSIDSGTADSAFYDEFLEKLEKNGVQVIIDEYQLQLDEWLAARE